MPATDEGVPDDLNELLGLLELLPGILRDFADLAPDDLAAGIGDALRRIGGSPSSTAATCSGSTPTSS